MRLMSFSEINDLENGQQIPSLEGTVNKVFEPKTGVGEWGPWSLQNIILQDEHANEITCTWSGEDAFDPKQWEGKTILIESGKDKKEQLAGVRWEIRTKNGKKYESVKIDDRSKIKALNGGGERQPDAPVEAETKNRALCTGREDPPSSDIQLVREHLMRGANLYNLCVDAVNKCVAPHVPEMLKTSEWLQAAVASLWIEASSRRCTAGVTWWAYIEKMPAKPIKNE